MDVLGACSSDLKKFIIECNRPIIIETSFVSELWCNIARLLGPESFVAVPFIFLNFFLSGFRK
jgi:hypothetical protein